MLTLVRADDLATFYRRLYPSLFRFVFIRTGAPEADIEDLVQDILMQAWRNREGFAGQSAPETWVMAIAKNRVIDFLRSRGRRRHAEGDLRDALARMDESPIPSDLIDTDEMREKVAEAMESIEPEYAEVLTWRYLEGMPVRAIAERLGESEGAVESRLTRARNAFRKLVGGSNV